MKTLAYYNERISAVQTMLNKIHSIFLNDEITVDQFTWGVRSMELLYGEGYEHFDTFKEIEMLLPSLIIKLTPQVNTQVSVDNPSENIMLLMRGFLNLTGHSFGVENRFSIMKSDEHNMDIHGNVCVGFRLFEDFNDKILETFYK